MPRESGITEPFWTDARVLELRRRWANNESQTAIGLAMHISRGAISGKIDRLGLPCRRDDGLHRKPPPKKHRERQRPLPAGAVTLPPLPSLS